MTSTLLHSPSQILVQLLLDSGLVNAYSSQTWPGWWDGEADAPDNAVTVTDTAGETDRNMVDGEIDERCGFQVRVRSSVPQVGRSKAAAIREFMGTVAQRLVTVESTLYLVHALVKLGPILSLGKDVPRSKRSLFTLNGLMPVSAR